MRHKTVDAAVMDRNAFYSVERLGAKQSVTPEGFLVCHDVPIARTGTLIYGAHEVPVEAGRDGLVRIDRTDAEVFRPETLASFEGKPVTLDHPDDFVTPATWKELSVGIVQNVRRAGGIEDDLLLADLVITDQQAIDEVRSGLREVSCGYEADYEQVEPGRGLQRNIVGNHVALVERGRCGPRCAIGDKEPEMKGMKKWADRIRAAMKSKDAAAAEEIAKEMEAADSEESEEDKEEKTQTGDKATLDAILATLKSLDKRVKDMEEEKEKAEDSEEEEEKEETEDDLLEAEEAEHKPEAAGETYTGDSAVTWRDMLARAEILAPGVTMPTRDSKQKFADALCGCQRHALGKAYQSEDGKKAIEPFLAGRDLSRLTADQINAAFIGASELMKAQNNARGVRGSITTKDFGRATNAADINAQNRKFWADRAGH